MRDHPDDAIPWVSAADDRILDPVPTDRSEAVSRRRWPPLAARLLNYGPHAALVAWLFGAAWLMGSHFIVSTPVVVGDDSVRNAEMRDAAQKASAERYAQETDVGVVRVAQNPSTKAGAGLGTAKPRLDATNSEGGTAVAEVSGKRPKPAEKHSQVGERVDRIGLEIAALFAAAPAADRSVDAARVARRRAHSARHDAFDPSQNPNAPGAPRPLGTFVGAAITNNSRTE